MAQWLIYTDGGSRGNPGPAAIGVVVYSFDDDTALPSPSQLAQTSNIDQLAGSIIYEHSSTLGTATNNAAEYQALLHSAHWAVDSPHLDQVSQVVWRLDSKLVVQQVLRNWKVKHPDIRPLAEEAWQLLDQIPCSYQLEHVRRELNSRADALVNQALDN